MSEPQLPAGLEEARRTPLFDATSLPEPLAVSHRTTVWAELRVQSGSVHYYDLEGSEPRDARLDEGDTAIIAPGVEHHVEPSTDAEFYIQFYRSPDSVPTIAAVESHRGAGPWSHRGCDLDSPDEIFEMVTRQYSDVVQDDLLQPYFNFGPGFIDWQAHIGAVADYWCHVLLYAPSYEIDAIEIHRPLHDRDPFTPELFDRWLESSVAPSTPDGPAPVRRARRSEQQVWPGSWPTASSAKAYGSLRNAAPEHLSNRLPDWNRSPPGRHRLRISAADAVGDVVR